MDLSPHPQNNNNNNNNWLGFSLSSPQSSLFHAFTSSSTSSAAAGTAPPQDLSTFSAGPKLEDFLGGASTAPPPPQYQLGLSPFTADQTLALCDTHELYDSELKSIAASFLRGFSAADQTFQNQNNKQQLLNPVEPPPKKAVDTFGQRTSIYRGVTRHRWTGRYEAHLWDNSCRREGQSRKGRQVYLGGYDKEEKAARAYDLAALKYWGPTTTTNFPISNYEKEVEEMKNMTRQEFVASLRRKSSGFSRGASMYRGVTRHHQHGRWQARIGRVAGNKDLYLGTFSTQEEAAEAYDIAAIKFRGLNAVTNFDMSRYDVKSIANSNLPIGGMANKSKNSSDSHSDNNNSKSTSEEQDLSTVSFGVTEAATSTLSFALPMKQDHYWPLLQSNMNPGHVNVGMYHPHHHQQHGSNGEGSSAALQAAGTGSVAGFNMDFSSSNNHNNGVSLNGEGGGCFPSPMASSNSKSNSENYEGYGSWVAPTLHTFQSAKPNLSVYQTPIFGME